MAALAVGIVGDDVERAEDLELVLTPALFQQGEVVLLVVGFDEQLERARSERCVLAHDRRRDHPPAQCL